MIVLFTALIFVLCLLYKLYMVKLKKKKKCRLLKINLRFQDQFKKWSHLPAIEPHWFWGNRRILSESFKETFHNHYKALKGHR